MLSEYLYSFLEQLQKEVLQLNYELAGYPEGTLLANANGKYTKFMLSNGINPIVLHKKIPKELTLARQLAVKKVKVTLREEKLKEIALLHKCLDKCNQIPYASSKLLEPHSPYYELIQEELQHIPSYARDWANEPYVHYSGFPEHLKLKTLAGELVRSKSEVIIANSLFLHHIPYRYECQLILGEVSFFPDFTILHPLTHKIWYYEHLGMLDQAKYRNSAFEKLQIYGNHNILPFINLLFTCETNDHPINSKEIDQLVETYFC